MRSAFILFFIIMLVLLVPFQHYLTSRTRNSVLIHPKLRLLLIIHDLNHRDTALRRYTLCCTSFEWQVCEEVLNHCSPLEFCPWPFFSSWLDFDLLLSSEGSESSFSVTKKTMKKHTFTIHLWEKSMHRCIRLSTLPVIRDTILWMLDTFYCRIVRKNSNPSYYIT